MKHQLKLPDRPSVLYLIILFDLFALVAVYGMYATNWVSSTGTVLELPRVSVQNELLAPGESLVVKLTGRTGQSLEVGQEIFSRDEALSFLSQRKAEGLETILLMVERTLPVALEREVISQLQGLGLKLVLISETAQ